MMIVALILSALASGGPEDAGLIEVVDFEPYALAIDLWEETLSRADKFKLFFDNWHISPEREKEINKVFTIMNEFMKSNVEDDELPYSQRPFRLDGISLKIALGVFK